MASRAWDEWAPWLADRAGELSAAVLFLTRLPLPRHAQDSGAVSRGAVSQAVWAFPLVGFVVGLVGAVVYAIADRLAQVCWPAGGVRSAPSVRARGAARWGGRGHT